MAIKKQNQSGMTLSGLLVAMAIIVVGLVYLLGIASFSLKAVALKEKVYQAGFIAQEMLEGTRSFRDANTWAAGIGGVNLGVGYRIEKAGTPLVFTLVLGAQNLAGFERKIIFYEVRRDVANNIVEAGGLADLNSKKAVATVSWQENGELKKVEISNLFANWQ